MKQQFEKDLQEVYKLATELRGKHILCYNKALKEDCKEREEVNSFLEKMGIPISGEAIYAVVKRIVNNNEAPLREHMVALNKGEKLERERMKAEGATFRYPDNYKFNGKKMDEVVNHAYLLSVELNAKYDSALVSAIDERGLLSPFYQTLLIQAVMIGDAFNQFHEMWTRHIINDINKDLERLFAVGELVYVDGKKAESIIEWLRDKNLLDKGHGGEEADRSYSALIRKYSLDGQFADKDGRRYDFERKAYCEAFPVEVRDILLSLEQAIYCLGDLYDPVYGKRDEWVEYFWALTYAFAETDCDKLVDRWAKVDRAWMKIDTPIQVVHPLEYYEDKYRKAVAPEWDIRIVNMGLPQSKMAEKIERMFDEEARIFAGQTLSMFEHSLNSIKKVQLYLGKPIMLFGSCLIGEVSAQIVPNDTIVSAEEGKKIFAFPDRILAIHRDAPQTKLGPETLEQWVLDENKAFLQNEEDLFRRLYDIETVGHEFGHALWLDEDTEQKMNISGQFKNIEEWKATVGGTMAFFYHEEPELRRHWMRDLVLRVLKCLARKEQSHLHPYYCEALIHLQGLVDSGVVEFNGDKIFSNFHEENYQRLKNWYLDTYPELAKHYMHKRDAKEFLDKYMEPVDGTYLPLREDLKEIVLWYYAKYQEFGNQLVE
jgi:hypothetical protein